MNYETLLKKYIEHVLGCEGWTYVENINDHTRSDVKFTDEEKAVLERMDKEL